LPQLAPTGLPCHPGDGAHKNRVWPKNKNIHADVFEVPLRSMAITSATYFGALEVMGERAALRLINDYGLYTSLPCVHKQVADKYTLVKTGTWAPSVGFYNVPNKTSGVKVPVQINIYMYIYIYTYIYIHPSIYPYIHTRARAHTHTHTNISGVSHSTHKLYIYTYCIYIYVYIHVCMYVCMYVYIIYIYIHIYICIYMS
jgi:hypothetical protein